jgi:hypothetical protein
MSPSQKAVRAVLLLASWSMVALTVVAAPHPVVVVALLLVIVSPLAAARPGSWMVAALLLGQALHWSMSVPVPTTLTVWLELLGAALLGLLLHVSAALAAALPPQAPVPSVTLRRWAGRTTLVAVLIVPVWALAAVSGQRGVAGEVSLTYAAIAAAAILALSLWMVSRESDQ